MRHLSTLFFCSMLLLPSLSFAKQHALLIGVSDYQNKRITDLEGPQYDVPAMQRVLNEHWGVDKKNMVSLVNEQATEANIKAQLNALQARTKPGDDIVIYFSGHGTSVKDPDFGAKLNLPDASGALVTHDFDPAKHIARIRAGKPIGADDDGLLIGRYEIKPMLQALSEDRTVLVVFDSCFSGNAVRGQSTRYTPKAKRLLNISLGTESEPEIRTGVTGASRCLNCNPHDSTPVFEYDNVIYFGAAADNQLAVDYSQAEIDSGLVSTFDNKPHGGFTDALLRVLSSQTAEQNHSLSYRRLFNLLVSTFSAHCPNCAHNPVLLPTKNARTLSKAFLSSVIIDPLPGNLKLETTLAIETQNISTELTLSMSQLPSVEVNSRNADIALNQHDQFIEARAADGQLISQLPSDWEADRITEWVGDQLWLKQRKRADAINSLGAINANFRNPLENPVAFEGESVYFTISLESDARLVVLLTNSLGKLSVLYPHSEDEAKQVYKANSRFQFPAPNEFQFSVSEPWGTDNVAIYALPADSQLSKLLLPLARVADFSHTNEALSRFTKQLDSKQHDYSAAHVRFHATQ